MHVPFHVYHHWLQSRLSNVDHVMIKKNMPSIEAQFVFKKQNKCYWIYYQTEIRTLGAYMHIDEQARSYCLQLKQPSSNSEYTHSQSINITPAQSATLHPPSLPLPLSPSLSLDPL